MIAATDHLLISVLYLGWNNFQYLTESLPWVELSVKFCFYIFSMTVALIINKTGLCSEVSSHRFSVSILVEKISLEIKNPTSQELLSYQKEEWESHFEMFLSVSKSLRLPGVISFQPQAAFSTLKFHSRIKHEPSFENTSRNCFCIILWGGG